MVSPGRRRTSWISLGLIIALYSSRTFAQTPGGLFPTCISLWFLFDNNNHIPCQTLQEQMAVCTGDNTFTIPAVSSQSLGLYPVPNDSSAINLVCECTEAVYNLFQACAACQNATSLSNRQTWFKSCPMSLSDIPIKTDNMTDQTFWVDQVYNPAFTLDAAIQAEHTNQPPPNSGSPASSSSGDQNSDGSDEPNVSSSSSSTKSNTGMIVGIVVGVIGSLVILALLLFFFLRRKRQSRTAPSAEFMKYAQPNAATIPLTQTSHDEESSTIGPHMRNSVIRGDSGGGMTMTDESDGAAPPSFTPGLFKDPIFEKGAALNIANNAGYSATGSPVTYSPATPSVAGGGMGIGGSSILNPEQQRLIGTSSSSAMHGQVKRGSL